MDDDEDPAKEHIQVWDAPPELRLRIRFAAVERGVSMSRYLIDLLDEVVPPLPRR